LPGKFIIVTNDRKAARENYLGEVLNRMKNYAGNEPGLKQDLLSTLYNFLLKEGVKPIKYFGSEDEQKLQI